MKIKNRTIIERALLAAALELTLSSAADAQGAMPVLLEKAKEDIGAETVQKVVDAPVQQIVVTGQRAAMAKARELKKNSSVLQDSISATELGRFPDDNVADSLTHITGVTISRTKGGEGQYVSIRGLGPQFNVVTLNNRILATDGDGRDFAFDVLPSSVIGGADVKKSAEASQIEGSLGALVNLRAARAMDNPGFHSSFRLEADNNDLSRKTGQKLTGVVSNTFSNNTVGVMLGFVYSKKNERSDYIQEHAFTPPGGYGWTGEFDANRDGVISVGEKNLFSSCCFSVGTTLEDKKRMALSGALEWKATSQLKFTLDALGTRLDAPQRGYTQSYFVAYEANPDTGYERWIGPAKIKNQLVTDYTVQNFNPELSTISTHRVVDTTQLGLKMEWKLTDNLKLVGDGYRSTSKRLSGGKDGWVVAGIAGNNTAMVSEHDNAVPNIDVTLSDGRNYATELLKGRLGNADFGPHYAGLRGNDIRDTVTGFSLDGKLMLHGKWNMEDLSFGISDTSREKSRNTISNEKTGGSCQYCGMYGTTFSQLGGGVVQPISLTNFMRNAGGNLPSNFVRFDYDAYFNALKKLDGQPITNNDIYLAQYGTYDSKRTLPVLDATDSYRVKEKTVAAYFQADLSGEKWQGNLGFRLLRTNTVSSTAVDKINKITDLKPDDPTSSPNVEYSPSTPVSESGSYTKLLPSANFGYWFTPSLLARTALAKVIARPSLYQLAPTRTDNVISRSNFIEYHGNAKLKPVEAVQMDLSLEWYYEPKSILSGAIFGKKLKNFITSSVTEHVDLGVIGQDPNTHGPYLFSIGRPINGDKATVFGAEVGFEHFFNNGFGLNAKYSRTTTLSYQGGVYAGPLENVAPNNFSLGLLYEANGISANISLDRTGEFKASNNTGIASRPQMMDRQLWVSASASYDIKKNVTVFIEGRNLTDEIQRGNLGQANMMNLFETYGRTFLIGINLKN